MIVLGLDKTVTKLGYRSYREIYFDYMNNFLTVQGFADYNNIDYEIAENLINNGKELYGDN